MGAEPSVVLGAEASNLFFDGWDLYVTPNNGIWDIPWSISYQTQGFRLKAFQNFNVGCGGCAP
jgi:hypothetical protein